MNHKGALALSQIFILIIGIVAISYAVGSEVGVVRGKLEDENTKKDTPKEVEDKSEDTNPDKLLTFPINLDKITTITLPANLFRFPTMKNPLEGLPTHIKDSTDGKDDSKKEKTITDNKDKTPKDDEEEPETKEILGFLKVKKGGFADAIITGGIYAGIAYAAIKFIGPMLGMEQELVDAASFSVSIGLFAGQATNVLATEWKTKELEKKGDPLTKKKGAAYGAGVGAAAGAGVGILLFIFSYQKKSQEVITFTCYPWDAATGGNNCELCNKQGNLPCSEYQCRSLGQACQLLNPGTKEEKCAWVNKNDVKFPTIEPWKDALLKNYKYKPDGATSPPDKGVIIWNENSTSGCVKAFTPLSFGVSLDEPAKCKMDVIRKKSFDEMLFYFSGSSSLYNHSYTMSLPGSSAFKSENITLEGEGDYTIYVKCQDANGNVNTADFVFKFCVEKGPDTTPPLIVTTTPLNNYPIAYNQTSLNTAVYVNEPAECKWSHLDQDYKSMEGNMTCSSDLFEVNAQMLYTCATTLTGLKDRQENKFYFRCNDQPNLKGTSKESDRNANRESYKFSLMGTQPLVIDWIKPENGSIISDATDSVKVTLEAKTSAGYKEGESVCYYSDTGTAADYVPFFKTNSYQHSQELWLPKGSYKYFIKCIDLGGNSDIKSVNFAVESDSSSPIVVRAYHEETYLRLATNEPARCVYDTKYKDYPCDYSFDDGTPIKVIDDVNHYTDWDTASNLYITCQDKYGNQPVPNKCSIIIRPSDFPSEVY